jgi:hypothetical protein
MVAMLNLNLRIGKSRNRAALLASVPEVKTGQRELATSLANCLLSTRK